MGWQNKKEKLTVEHKAVLADMVMAFGDMFHDGQMLRARVGDVSLAWLPTEQKAADAALSSLAQHAFTITSAFMSDDDAEYSLVTKAPKVIREHGRSFINKAALMEYAAQDMVFRAEFEDHYDQALATLQGLLSAQLDQSLHSAQQKSRDVS